jgi:hypothetical protein
VLFLLDPGVERRLVISWKYRHSSLSNDRTMVNLLVDKMNRDTAHLDPCSQGLLYGIDTGEGRKKGGMDIEDPVWEASHRLLSKYPHETS